MFHLTLPKIGPIFFSTLAQGFRFFSDESVNIDGR